MCPTVPPPRRQSRSFSRGGVACRRANSRILMIPHRSAIEAKFTALDLKSTDEAGEFEGYASLFNREDLGHDVVLPGAFTHSLSARGASGVRLLFQHDPAEPIGVWEELREDGRGLYVKGRLLPDVARAREVLSLMRAGAVDGLSIGFRSTRAKRDAKTGIRSIAQIDLWEISIVTFPMLPEARITGVKARPFAGHTPTPREFERWLMRDAGLSRSEARALIGHGLKGLAAKRDAGGAASDDARLLATIRAATRLMHPNTDLITRTQS